MNIPSFHHALKDLLLHTVPIHVHHQIVAVEGMYTLLSIELLVPGRKQLG